MIVSKGRENAERSLEIVEIDEVITIDGIEEDRETDLEEDF